MPRPQEEQEADEEASAEQEVYDEDYEEDFGEDEEEARDNSGNLQDDEGQGGDAADIADSLEESEAAAGASGEDSEGLGDKASTAASIATTDVDEGQAHGVGRAVVLGLRLEAGVPGPPAARRTDLGPLEPPEPPEPPDGDWGELQEEALASFGGEADDMGMAPCSPGAGARDEEADIPEGEEDGQLITSATDDAEDIEMPVLPEEATSPRTSHTREGCPANDADDVALELEADLEKQLAELHQEVVGEDPPGHYYMLLDASVTDGIARNSELVTWVEAGTLVHVREVVRFEEECRLRGRLRRPRGWISLLDIQAEYRWAEFRAPASEESDEEAEREEAAAKATAALVAATAAAAAASAAAAAAALATSAEESVSSSAPTTREDGPGFYRITKNASVTTDVSRNSILILWLETGWLVRVLEVVRCEDEFRVRARLAEPEGWISLEDMETGSRWAEFVPLDANVAEQPYLDGPGSYLITKLVPLTSALLQNSPAVLQLDPGTLVEVLEVARCEEAQQVRARLREPAPGWISLLRTEDKHRWAEKLGGGEELTEEAAAAEPREAPEEAPEREAATRELSRGAAGPAATATRSEAEPAGPAEAAAERALETASEVLVGGQAAAEGVELLQGAEPAAAGAGAGGSPRGLGRPPRSPGPELPTAQGSPRRSSVGSQVSSCCVSARLGESPRRYFMGPRPTLKDELFALMKEKGGGSVAVAWRRYFDCAGSKGLSFREFSSALESLGYAGDALALWAELGSPVEMPWQQLIDEAGRHMVESFDLWCKSACGGALEMFDLVNNDRGACPRVRVESFVQGLRDLGLFRAPGLAPELASEAEFRCAMLPVIDPWGSGTLLPEALLFLERDPKLRRKLRRKVEQDRESSIEAPAAYHGHRPRVPRASAASASPKRSAAAELLGGLAKRNIPQLGGKHWKQLEEEDLPLPPPPLPAAQAPPLTGGASSSTALAAPAAPAAHSGGSGLPPSGLRQCGRGRRSTSCRKAATGACSGPGAPAGSAAPGLAPSLSLPELNPGRPSAAGLQASPSLPERLRPPSSARSTSSRAPAASGSVAGSASVAGSHATTVAAAAVMRHRRLSRKLYGQKLETALPTLGAKLEWHQPPDAAKATAAVRCSSQQLDSAVAPAHGEDFFRRGISRNLFERYYESAAGAAR